jgi:TonB family protein
MNGLLRIAGAYTMLALAASCGRSVRPPDVLVVTPASATAYPRDTLRFQAWFNGRPLDVAWSVSGPGVMSGDGDYVAPGAVPDQDRAEVVAVSLGITPVRTGHAWVGLPWANAASADSCLGEGQDHIPGEDEVVPVDAAPEALIRILPSYPDSARIAGVQGTVLLSAAVCRTGRVIEVDVVTSIPMLDAAAVEAVSRWVFRPALRAGSPIAARVTIPVKFTIH